VIGGGIIGCSVLYHLVKMGWQDSVLIEKNELTSGSTWMAAGNVTQFAFSRTPTRLIKYSIELYKKLEEETEQPTDWHATGSLRLATNQKRLDEFKHVVCKDRSIDVPSEIIDPREAKRLFPLMSGDNVLGALYYPHDGHVDANGVTQALARGAKINGAEIYRFNRVTSIQERQNGEWKIETEKGNIIAENLVCCPGPWAAQLARMFGSYLPVISMEHQHVLFDDIAEVRELNQELPVLRDPDIPFYLRREMDSLLVGPYEKKCKAWKAEGVPWEFAQKSIPPDIDRFQENMLRIFDRVPVIQNAGIKQVMNGPITYTPDGTPLLGPIYGKQNLFVMAGINMGITLAGGLGKHMANWIVDGDPGIDFSAYDPRRFGKWVSPRYCFEKVHEAYQLNWTPSYPDRERPGARPVKASPIYDLQVAQGGVFGARYGWERANWFAPKGIKPVDELSFKRRSNYFEHVGQECLAVRDKVAIYDLSSLSKFEISGPGAESYLDQICTNRMPGIGKIVLTTMLNEEGLIYSDAILVRLAKERFYFLSASGAELRNLQWLENHLPADGGVIIDNVTNSYGVLTIVGPKSRELLAELTEIDLATKSFPFFTAQTTYMDFSPVRALRLNFVGELGWELHHPIEHQRRLYEALTEIGKDYGMACCGMRALNSLRLEKGYRGAAELTGEDTPLEAGLDAFVKFNKGEFVGREKLLSRMKNNGGPTKKLVCLTVECDHADAFGDQPVYSRDEVVGRVTSGGYGHRVGKSIALAYVCPGFDEVGTRLSVEIFCEKFPAQVVRLPFYDPDNLNLKL
jgi:dimethylglycine dehydrogenase